RRARPRDRAPDLGADRHALDHLAPPLARARADPSADPRDRRRTRGPRVAARTVGAGGWDHKWWGRLRGRGLGLVLAAAVTPCDGSGRGGRRLPVARYRG